MGRPRKHNRHLPRRVYFSHGQYYFVDVSRKWHPLGRSLGEMYRNLADFYESDSLLRTMADLFERYRLEILPKKALETQKGNALSLKRLETVFGHMKPAHIKPRDVYGYRDKRGTKTEVGANRDLEVLSHVFTKAIEWGAVDNNPCRDVRKFRESVNGNIKLTPFGAETAR